MRAGVDQSIRRSTRKPRLNQDENRCMKSSSTTREIVAAIHGVEQLLAHAHQRRGATRREIEPAQQFQPARLGGAVHFGARPRRRIVAPGLTAALESLPVRAERVRQRLEESDARSGGELAIARQDLAASATPEASPRPESSSSHNWMRLAERCSRGSRRSSRSISARPRSAMRLQHVAKKRGVHGRNSLNQLGGSEIMIAPKVRFTNRVNSTAQPVWTTYAVRARVSRTPMS